MPLSRNVAEQMEDRLLRGGVDPREGLVEDEQLRLLGERAGEEDTLLLPAGERADLPRRECRHAHPRQCVMHARLVGGGRTAAEANGGVAAHQHDIMHRDGELPVHRLALRHVGDAAARLPDRRTEEHHTAPLVRLHPHDRVQERRLARPIRPDNARHRPRREGNADPFNGRRPMIRDGNIPNLNHRLITVDIRLLPLPRWGRGSSREVRAASIISAHSQSLLRHRPSFSGTCPHHCRAGRAYRHTMYQ